MEENLKYHTNTPVSFMKEYMYLGKVIESTLTFSNNLERVYKLTSDCFRFLSIARDHLNVHASTEMFNMITSLILTYSGVLKLVQTNHSVSLHCKTETVTCIKIWQCPTKEINVTSVGIKCLEKWANNSNFSNYLKMLNHQRSPEIKIYEWNYYVWNLKQQSIVFISQKLRFIIAFQWKLDQGIFKKFSNTFLTIFNFLIFPLILSFR